MGLELQAKYTEKCPRVNKKWFLVLILSLVSASFYYFTGSPLAVNVSIPVTVSSQTSPAPLPSEPIVQSEYQKIDQPKQAGNTAFTAKGVRHAIISNNIVEGFNKVAEVEHIETLDMSGNLAMAPSK
jgi:hypothetical protein